MGSFVDPPLTIAVHSPSSPCSPPRSPRMASLLSALQDIIGPDSPDVVNSAAFTGEIQPLDVSDASHLPLDVVQGTAGVSSGKREIVQASHVTNLSPPPCKTGQVENEGDFSIDTSCSIDKDMQKDPVSPPGLLSPVQLGSVPPIPFPHAGLGAALARDDLNDSGYAETWVGPTPFSLSPPQLNQPSSTLYLLFSPFGSPLSRVLPKRTLPSPSQQRTSLPAPRDSIDIVSPSSFVPTSPRHILPSHASPIRALSSGQGGAEDTDPSDRALDESDQSGSALVGSPSESLMSLITSDEVPVLKNSLSLVSYENHVDPQFAVDKIPGEDSPGRREDAPYPVEGAAEGSLVSGQLPLAETSHVDDPLPFSVSPVDILATSPLRPKITLQSPITIETTVDDEEFDYEALYQLLIMSPKEVESKRISSASLPSPRSLPSRTISTGSHSSRRSSSAPVNIPERANSTVDKPPWSRHRDLAIAPVLLSENTSRTSSPILETPMSSSPVQADDASALSVNASPVSLPASGLGAHPSLSTPSSKHSRRPAVQSPLGSASIAGPSSGSTFTLNGRYESEPVKSKWNRISTSKKVPFGFRNSLVCLCLLLHFY
jgi:hypothetical protein